MLTLATLSRVQQQVQAGPAKWPNISPHVHPAGRADKSVSEQDLLLQLLLLVRPLADSLRLVDKLLAIHLRRLESLDYRRMCQHQDQIEWVFQVHFKLMTETTTKSNIVKIPHL